MFLPVSPKNAGIYFDEKDKTFKNVVSLSDDMKTALNCFRKAYEEGVMNKEYNVSKTRKL